MENKLKEKENPAHFDQVRIQNKKIVRNILWEEAPLGITQLSRKAGLSYPTVAALLKELQDSDVVRLAEGTRSSGGRPGILFELNPYSQYGAVLYFEEWDLKCIVYDVLGREKERKAIPMDQNADENQILILLKKMKEKYGRLSVVSMGVPGVVCDNVIRYLPRFKNLEGKGFWMRMEEELDVTCFIENDVNAIVLGETGQFKNFAHIIYVNDCIGVGIVLNGMLYRGTQGYAGEMEYLCHNSTDKIKVMEEAVLAITCVLDLPDILISEERFDQRDMMYLKRNLAEKLPGDRMPQLTLQTSTAQRYEQGLLTRIMQCWKEEN